MNNTKIYRFALIIAFILSLSLQSVAQVQLIEDEIIILDDELDDEKSFEYTAKDYISFLHGFKYIAQDDNYLSGTINPDLVIEPTTGIYGGHPYKNLNGGVVGTLPGNLTVSPTGGAIFSIPIEFPPGNHGMTPTLGLTYNSQGGNGLLGMGWKLSGLSEITRVGTNIYHEGYISGIKFDDIDDRFVLDGLRLIPVGINEFRTDIESFSKIIAHESPFDDHPIVKFEVWTKDGKHMEYGFSDDSQIKMVSSATPYKYLLNRVEDRDGNYIEYNYHNDPIQGSHFILSIRYGNSQHANPLYIVDFTYTEPITESRPDIYQGYPGSILHYRDRRLKDIRIYYTAELQTLLRWYKLRYEDNIYSYLDEVRLYDGSIEEDIWYNPMIFEYNQQGEQAFSEQVALTGPFTVYPDGWHDAKHIRTMADVDGDGRADIVGFGEEDIVVSLSNGNGFENPTVWLENGFCWSESGGSWVRGKHPRFVQDVDGDGDADIIGIGEDNVVVALSNGINGFELSSNPWYNGNTFGYGNGMDYATCIQTLADVNGDYLPDIVAFGHLSIVVALNTGSDFDPATTWLTSIFTSVNNWEIDKHPRIMTDVNGDGLADIVGFSENDGVLVALSNGINSFEYDPAPWHSSFDVGDGWEDNNQHPRTLADINGDGLADIIGFHEGGTYFGISTGSNFIPSTFNPINAFKKEDYPNQHGYPRYVTDFNGDGMADIVGFRWGQVEVALSNGTSIESPTSWTLGYGYGNGYEGLDYPRLVADINGDGCTDIIGFGWGEVASSLSLRDEICQITSITNGLGIKKIITYTSMHDIDHYTRGEDATWPVMDFEGPLKLVKSIQDSEAHFPVNYYYEGARIHLEGKGFIGFTKVSTIGQMTETTFRHIVDYFNYDHTYFLNRSWKRTLDLETSSGVHNIMETISTNSIKSFPNKRMFPYVESSFSKHYELDGSFVKCSKTYTEYSDDEYGNITLQKTLTSPIELDINASDLSFPFRKIINNIYEVENTDDWIIGLVSQSTASEFHPDDPGVSNDNQTIYNYFPPGDDDYPKLQFVTVTPNSNSNLSITTEYVYSDDNYGNIIKQESTSPGNTTVKTTEFDYDDDYKRFLTESEKTIDGVLFKTEKEYDQVTGNLISSTDENGLITAYEYDSFDRLYKTYYPNNTVQTNALRWNDGHPDAIDINDQCLYYIWSKTTGEAESYTFFDEFGREIRNVNIGFDGTKIFSDKKYNVVFLVNEIWEPYFKGESILAKKTFIEYDESNRVTSTVTPTDVTINTTYNGLVTTTTNTSTGNFVTKTVNAIGQTKIIEDDCGEIEYTYHKSGKLKEISNDEVSVTMDYDDAGRQTELNDPNAGIMSYIYDSWGNLISQTDEGGNTYTMIYDALGRIKSKTLVGGDVTTYLYDGAKVGLMDEMYNAEHKMEYLYDYNGRLRGYREKIDNMQFGYTYLEYNTFWKISKKTYPSGFVLNYSYDDKGFLEYIKREDTDEKIWIPVEYNAKGQILEYSLGNGLNTVKTYDEYGFPNFITTGNIQDLDFDFDPITGNLSQRKDNNFGLTETFTYDTDKLNNRLTGWAVTGGSSYSLTLDDNGNILTKSDVGTYHYEGSVNAGPHAVSGLTFDQPGDPGYTHDQHIDYTAFNSTEKITETVTIGANDYNYELNFMYGTDEQRVKTDLIEKIDGQPDENIKTKVFLSSGVEIETDHINNTERTMHYLSVGPEIFAICVKEDDGTWNMFYSHNDYLGSLYAVTDVDGDIVNHNGADQVYSFDPWGRKRNHLTWDYTGTPDESKFLFDLGYSGHEHLDLFGLINMNGRMYDPVLCRMLSTDNFVQDPGSAQNMNRYAYVMNNPLKYTDPSGELVWFTPVIYAAVNVGVDLIMNDGNMNFGEIAMSAGMGAIGGFLGGGAIATPAGAFSSALFSQVNKFLPNIPLYSSDNISVGISPMIGLGTSGPTIGASLNANGRSGDFVYSFNAGFGYNSGVSNIGKSVNAGGSYLNLGTFIGWNDGHANYGLGWTSSSFGGNLAQNTGALTAQIGDFSLRVDNDMFAGNKEDQYRTGGALMTYRVNDDLTLAFGGSMMTGKPDKGQILDDDTPNGTYNPDYEQNKMRGGSMYGGAIYKGQAYFGGHSSENRLHAVQNFIHRTLFQSPYFADLKRGAGRYSYYGGYNSNYLFY